MICKFSFVYPADYIDQERLAQDPDYVPGAFGPVEDYDIRLVDVPPQVGDQVEFNGGNWFIATIDPYHSEHGVFYVASCTQDGSIPHRQDWDNTLPKVLTVYVDGGKPLPEFEISERPIAKGIPFKPVSRPIAGYDLVLVA